MNALSRIAALYRTFGPFLKQYRSRVLLGFAALGASVGMALLRPWPIKLVLDGVLLKQRPLTEMLPWAPQVLTTWTPETLVGLFCVSLIAIVLLESLFGYLQKIEFSEVGQSSTTDVLEHVFTHLQTLPRSAMKQTRSGDVIVRLTSDVKTLRDLLVNHQQRLFTYAVTFVSTMAVMAWMNWRLTLLALGVVPLIYAASFHFAVQIRKASERRRRQEGAVASVVQEALHAMPVVQAFSQEEAEKQRFRSEARQTLDAALESSRLGGAFTRSIQVLNAVGTAVVIWFGGLRVLEGTLTPGDLVVFIAYVTALYVPIQNLSELAVQFMDSLVSGERVMELLKTAPRIQDGPHAAKAPRFRGDIEFRGVTARYEGDQPVLHEASFRVKAGENVALVGGSGAGKSTIVNLLLRFLDPVDGQVLIDGVDIRTYRLRSLRGQIGVVLQEPILFRRTVRDNIAYGKPGATDAEILAAAQAARALEFIEAMPEGFNTMLDERGGNLSGGQRQRITLARAFLRDAPILVMDEPSTGLDAVTEAELSQTVRELSRNRTTLMVAHKLSAVEDADLILVLDRGRVVQQGTHATLMAEGGLYRTLYETQAGDPQAATHTRG